VARYSYTRWLIGALSRPIFWLILLLLALITILHYAEALAFPSFIAELIYKLDLDRHAFERILYLAPIVWAGFVFGWRGAVVISLMALVLMLPRAFFISPSPRDAFIESFAVFIVGNVLAISFASLRREREYRAQLEVARQDLEANIEIIRENERQLTTLNQIAGTVSQSLDLSQVLDSAIGSVVDVMQVDIAWIYLLNEEAGELTMSVYRGVAEEVIKGVDKLKVGEGFNGQVAQTGEPMFVADASQDSKLTREVVSKHNIHSVLIAPLRYRAKVNGTLCVAMYSQREFHQEEIELLSAIGNQIGAAVENARLYQQQQEVAEQLRSMQENLRYYLHQATKAQEEERKRISRELHDDTIQDLVVLSRQLDALASNKELSEGSRRDLEGLWQRTDDIIKEVRRLSQDLRPAALDRLGLLPALERLASDVADYSGIEIKVKFNGEERRLNEEAELILFRITQEAVRNVWRHAQATKAEIEVNFEKGRVRVVVSDNGEGFEIPDKLGALARDGKLGLAGMQERAQLIGGELVVKSTPGKGSAVTVEVPV
jgi:signal transduction histidine kinase